MANESEHARMCKEMEQMKEELKETEEKRSLEVSRRKTLFPTDLPTTQEGSHERERERERETK